MNRYFSFRIQDADGGYSRGPWNKQDLNVFEHTHKHFKVFAGSAGELEQGRNSADDDDDAVPIKRLSLPPYSQVRRS